MTSQKQTSLFTEEQLTSSQEASHANHIHQQESGSEKKMNAICGPACLEQYEKFSHIGLWAKTFSALLIGMEGWYSKRCKLTWKLKGTKYNRMYFQLRPLTLHTEGIGFGLLLLKTPTKMDGEVSSGKANPVSGNSGTLAQEIMSGYAPTMIKLGMLPTPSARDWKGEGGNGADLNRTIGTGTGTTSQLSPQFVLEMMGFPTDWTELPFLNGETNQ
jgi:hypothetical protein